MGAPSWSPDGSTMAFESFVAIASADVRGSGFRLHVPAPSFHPAWGPGGRSLIFHRFSSRVGDNISSLGRRMRIYVVSLDDGAVRQLIPEATHPRGPNYWDHQAVSLRVRE